LSPLKEPHSTIFSSEPSVIRRVAVNAKAHRVRTARVTELPTSRVYYETTPHHVMGWSLT
jgi:hypothetical protein